MEEEVKVTVIATGFNQPESRRAAAEARSMPENEPFFTPRSEVRPEPEPFHLAEPAATAARPAPEPAPAADEPEEIPFYRKVIAQTQGEDPNGYGPNWSNVDDFDIPTVLRKQMD